MTSHVQIEHRRVGPLRVPNEDIIEIDYLPGFPDAHRFVLLEHAEGSPFLWMACLDDADLVFAVTDPCFFFPDYDPKLSQDDLEAIGAKAHADAVLLAIANVRGPIPALNLAAPVLLNRESRRAIQVLLPDERYSTRQPLPQPAEASAGASERGADGEETSAGQQESGD